METTFDPNVTERVRRIVAEATADAQRRQHAAVEGEHLLLGLIAEEECVAVAVLRSLGVDPDELTRQVEESFTPSGSRAPAERGVVLSATADRVLKVAAAEARALEHSYVGSEHLLIALVREERGMAAQALTQAGVTLAVVRHEALRLLSATAAPEAAGAAPGAVAHISIDVQRADGASVRREFRTVAAALDFLKAVGKEAVRGSAS